MMGDDFDAIMDDGVSQRRRAGGEARNRKHYRHPLHWRVAIVNKNGGRDEIFHGRTHDISQSGVSIHVERNVFFTEDVILLIGIPPQHHGLRETIVEVQCRVMHTVLDSDHGMFRIGMMFVHFKGDGKRILTDVLSKRHIPKQESNPYGGKKF